jgi:cytochrome c oxidase cbb3-type subunit 3
MKFGTYLEKITGVSIYPIISLLLFILVFSYVIYMIFKISNNEIEHMERIPLDDQPENKN